MTKFSKSRLQKIEEKRSLHQAIFFFLLTLILILVIFFIGLPLLVKFSVFLGKRQETPSYPKNNQFLIPIPPHLNFGVSATNSALFNLSGSAPAGMKIKIFLNEELIKEVTANNNGEFYLTKINLKEGKNTFRAVSVVEEKESEPSLATVIYKKTPPKLEIKQPQNNADFYDEEREIIIEGITDPQTKVTINEHLAMVDNEGNFSLRFTLNPGENDFKIIAEDEAGNQNQNQLKVNYTP